VIEVSEVRLRLTKASEDQETVRRYIKGHEEVLLHNGVKLSEGYDYWHSLETVYLLVAESLDGQTCYGGSRLHLWNGKDPLPVQSFLAPIENRVYEELDSLAANSGGILEIAGLWNSRLVAGLGLGSEHIIRTSIALSVFLQPRLVFTFCSPFVSRFADEFGFLPYRNLGNEGKFPFPDERWMSTINYLEDKFNLPYAKAEERNKIFEIRANKLFVKEYNDRGRNLKIHYQL
jgi:hypothetical protein